MQGVSFWRVEATTQLQPHVRVSGRNPVGLVDYWHVGFLRISRSLSLSLSLSFSLSLSLSLSPDFLRVSLSVCLSLSLSVSLFLSHTPEPRHQRQSK